MGGDLAYQWLEDQMSTGSAAPFVLVVEGANADSDGGGAWGDSSVASQAVPWCSIGMDDDASGELDFEEVVLDLGTDANCLAVIAIGQCATFGGYPACKADMTSDDAGFDVSQAQSGAKSTFELLSANGAGGKVINVPGCPTNPWWFTLTLVAWLVDAVTGPLVGGDGALGILNSDWSIKSSAVDADRRLVAVYGTPVHGSACPRYDDFLMGSFASQAGQSGCLQLIGCKGPSTSSLCGVHGWNAQQPQNDPSWANNMGALLADGGKGSHCITAGHPCMGCTENGYPDNFVPFVVR
jgi:hydrogenase small subunit